MLLSCQMEQLIDVTTKVVRIIEMMTYIWWIDYQEWLSIDTFDHVQQPWNSDNEVFSTGMRHQTTRLSKTIARDIDS
jgi:hypothetical protein